MGKEERRLQLAEHYSQLLADTFFFFFFNNQKFNFPLTEEFIK